MATRSVDIQQVAARKMLAQLIKHQKSDCVGLLIGHRNDKTVVVTDAVPLFHDHIFTGMLEVAMEMVDTCYNFQETDAIVGVDDLLMLLAQYGRECIAVEGTPEQCTDEQTAASLRAAVQHGSCQGQEAAAHARAEATRTGRETEKGAPAGDCKSDKTIGGSTSARTTHTHTHTHLID